MKLMVVSPPHGYTTRDVWKRVLSGLAANGVEVLPYDLLPRWRMWDELLALGEKKGMNIPSGIGANVLAYEPIVGAAIKHDADAVLLVCPQYFPGPIAHVLRKAGKKTIGYWTEAPYEDTTQAPLQSSDFDFAFVNDRYSVDLFRAFNPATFYLPHSFDPAIHYAPEEEARDDKVVFIGTGYSGRWDFFNRVDWSGIDFELRGIWRRRPGRQRLNKYIQAGVMENDETATMYRQNAVGLSLHRTQRYSMAEFEIDEGDAYSVGPRTYELAACGCFQISDYRRELIDIFGDTVPVYETPEELGAIVRQAISDPVWRQEKAAQQRLAVQGRDCATTMRYMLEQVA